MERGFSELSCFFCHVRAWTASSMGNKLKPDTLSVSTSILDSSAYRIVRINFCHFYVTQSNGVSQEPINKTIIHAPHDLFPLKFTHFEAHFLLLSPTKVDVNTLVH